MSAVVKPPRQSFVGTVIGTAMQKTIKVRVERIKMHPVVAKVWGLKKGHLWTNVDELTTNSAHSSSQKLSST